jgi:hypothetical protein
MFDLMKLGIKYKEVSEHDTYLCNGIQMCNVRYNHVLRLDPYLES